MKQIKKTNNMIKNILQNSYYSYFRIFGTGRPGHYVKKTKRQNEASQH